MDDRRVSRWAGMRAGKFAALSALALVITVASGCSAASYDTDAGADKAAILEQVHNYLTEGKCGDAITAIDPLYESKQVDNDVRMARASAYACAAGLPNFFAKLGELLLNAENLIGPGFWNAMTEMFYNSNQDSLDSRITAGAKSTEALLAALEDGKVVAYGNYLDDDRNPRSLLHSDRTADSNAYLMFVSMAMIGNMQSRYGAPDSSTFARGQTMGETASKPEGWTKAENVDFYACLYASSLLNLFDAMSATGSSLSGPIASAMGQVGTIFADQLGEACNAGCRGEALHFINYDTGCAFADNDCTGSSGRRCPAELRNPASCTGKTDDRASCAAAGLATYISMDPILGWQQ